MLDADQNKARIQKLIIITFESNKQYFLFDSASNILLGAISSPVFPDAAVDFSEFAS
jgi:hypothetical protein